MGKSTNKIWAKFSLSLPEGSASNFHGGDGFWFFHGRRDRDRKNDGSYFGNHPKRSELFRWVNWIWVNLSQNNQGMVLFAMGQSWELGSVEIRRGSIINSSPMVVIYWAYGLALIGMMIHDPWKVWFLGWVISSHGLTAFNLYLV